MTRGGVRRPRRRTVERLVVSLTGKVGGGPSPKRRARTRFAVVAEAHGPNGSRYVSLTGSDVYGLTAC